MKKRHLALLVALLLSITVCLSGCGLVLTTPSFFQQEEVKAELDLPIYNPGAVPYPKTEQTPPVINDGENNTFEVSETRPCYNLGSNKELSGRIVVLMAFVDDNTSTWTYQEIASFVEYQAKPALLYLADQAKNWNIELQFEIGVFATVISGTEIKYEGSVGTGTDGSSMSKDVLEHTAKDLGFVTPDSMLSMHRAQYSNVEIAYINVFNMPGRSYTCMQVTNPALEYTEHCVLFAQAYEGDPQLEETRAPTVAHEFLHLYGAEDFYTPDERATLAAEVYPTDIMLIAATSLDEITFSDMTAHMIGWHETAPEICTKDGWQAE
ncbi:MAG: hypothetical protein E7653_02540 [Ruminococcaceae bacterium]|nr:hypothetical protein [Oscillospiraceae bacterium]